MVLGQELIPTELEVAVHAAPGSIPAAVLAVRYSLSCRINFTTLSVVLILLQSRESACFFGKIFLQLSCYGKTPERPQFADGYGPSYPRNERAEASHHAGRRGRTGRIRGVGQGGLAPSGKGPNCQKVEGEIAIPGYNPIADGGIRTRTGPLKGSHPISSRARLLVSPRQHPRKRRRLDRMPRRSGTFLLLPKKKNGTRKLEGQLDASPIDAAPCRLTFTSAVMGHSDCAALLLQAMRMLGGSPCSCPVSGSRLSLTHNGKAGRSRQTTERMSLLLFHLVDDGQGYAQGNAAKADYDTNPAVLNPGSVMNSHSLRSWICMAAGESDFRDGGIVDCGEVSHGQHADDDEKDSHADEEGNVLPDGK